MNCYYHADAQAAAFCRDCGRPLCPACQKLSNGTVFCPDHAPLPEPGATAAESAPNNPYFQPSAGARVQTSPALAFALGWIPGVGAIYNGQYLKGLVHAVIFGLIISLLNSNENTSTAPFLGILLAAFIFYMPFEAYHTAKKRQAGLVVDEWSSFAAQPAPGNVARRGSIGPVVLIGIGVLFLLDTLNLIDFRHVGRFWPVVLIAVGAYMLYTRTLGYSPQNHPFGQPYTPPTPAAAHPDFVETRRDQ